jgi:hypothetical protein
MASVRLTLSGIDQLSSLQAVLTPKLYDKAIRGGISYASKAVPTAVSKGITASYNFTAARVKKDISKTQFVDNGQTALIRFSRRPPTLTQFKPNPGKRYPQPGLGRGKGWGSPIRAGRPLTATISRANGRQPFVGAFRAQGLNANSLVLRKDSSGRFYGVYGPSIGSIFLGQSDIGTQLRSDVQARINEQFIKGFQRVLDSASRPRKP